MSLAIEPMRLGGHIDDAVSGRVDFFVQRREIQTLQKFWCDDKEMVTEFGRRIARRFGFVARKAFPF